MKKSTIIAMLCSLIALPVYAVCGDCDENGAVTVDEILTTVNYALNGTREQPNPTPTPIIPITGSICSTSQPGEHFQACGEEWVVIEIKLQELGTQQSWGLRYPVKPDSVVGDNPSLTFPGISRSCPPKANTCSLAQPLFVCGFQGRLSVSSGSSKAYVTELILNEWEWEKAIKFSVSYGLSAYLQVILGNDGDFEKYTHLSFGCGDNERINVSDISDFNYSFLQANYDAQLSPDYDSVKQGLAEILRHISIFPISQ